MKVRALRPRRTVTPRPQSSLSARLISRKLQERLDLHSKVLYGEHTAGEPGYKRDPSPAANENQYYTVKYLGITNGELGVLSQRKPLVSPKGQFRYVIPPGPLTPQPRPTDLLSSALPAEFLKPNPGKYNEFIVHQYSRPRPLTASKREKGPASPTSQNWLIEGGKCGTAEIGPAKAERQGVAGWKLAWPRSHSSFAGRMRQKPVVQAAKPISHDSQNYVFGEAYLHYLLQLKPSKS